MNPKKHFIMFILVVLLASHAAWGCMRTNPDAYVSGDALISEAQTIVLVRLKSATLLNAEGEGTRYVLETVEAIKGVAEPSYQYSTRGRNIYSDNDFAGHAASEYWDKNIGRSQVSMAYCYAAAHAFQDGDTYLYFPGRPGALKSAEIVRNENDLWLRYVRAKATGGAVPAVPKGEGKIAAATGVATLPKQVSGLPLEPGNLVANADTHEVIQPASIQRSGEISLLAGNIGGAGRIDGVGTAARFLSPGEVAVDGLGNVYVADYNAIRKITPTGVVTTLAEGHVYPSDRQRATDCFGFLLKGFAADSTGNVYVSGNNSICKITPAGVVTPLAGKTEEKGFANGVGGVSRYSNLAVDSKGNVYGAAGHNDIHRISPTGEVTPVNLPISKSMQTYGPNVGVNGGFAVDGEGNLYASDFPRRTIYKITPSGMMTTLAGAANSTGAADGAGTTARFMGPVQVALDGTGNLYVRDDFHAVRKITPDGLVSTLAGSAGVRGRSDGLGSAASFWFLHGLAVDVSGNVYVSDDVTIRKITPEGLVTTLAGAGAVHGSTDGTGATASFESPKSLAVDGSGNVYLADRKSTIRKITQAGVVTTLAGNAGETGSVDGIGTTARFKNPRSITVDDKGNIYVADTMNNTIRMITPNGIVKTLAGTAGEAGSVDGIGAAARFHYPGSLAVDGNGNLYVVDNGNFTIRKITPAGEVTTLAGMAGKVGSVDGTGAAARFDHLGNITVDSSGNLYVVDNGNFTIRKITPAGEVTTLAGMRGKQGSVNGIGSSVRFDRLAGIAVDAKMNVYVTDINNHIIRKITSAGVVTTVAGKVGSRGVALGELPGSLSSPEALAMDKAGVLYVGSANAVLKISLP